jgi:hypothetical protein
MLAIDSAGEARKCVFKWKGNDVFTYEWLCLDYTYKCPAWINYVRYILVSKGI